MNKTPGQLDYERDVQRKPLYHDERILTMNTAKHTPGPWQANISEMEAHSALVQVRTANGGYLICSDAGYQNAPLIAAAPAMYEALKLATIMHPHNVTFQQALAQAEGKG